MGEFVILGETVSVVGAKNQRTPRVSMPNGDSDRPAMARAKYTKDKVTARGWAYYYVF
ncbi:MAG TPA: hypothetical protein V6D27_05090 [Vampirovibrionales bacterium]